MPDKFVDENNFWTAPVSDQACKSDTFNDSLLITIGKQKSRQ